MKTFLILATLLLALVACEYSHAATGYAGNFIAAKPIVIPSSDNTSAAYDLKGYTLVGLMMPTTFNGTAITFKVAPSLNGTYTDLYDTVGAIASVSVTASRAYSLDAKTFQGFQFMKFKSTAIEASRSINISLKGL